MSDALVFNEIWPLHLLVCVCSKTATTKIDSTSFGTCHSFFRRSTSGSHIVIKNCDSVKQRGVISTECFKTRIVQNFGFLSFFILTNRMMAR